MSNKNKFWMDINKMDGVNELGMFHTMFYRVAKKTAEHDPYGDVRAPYPFDEGDVDEIIKRKVKNQFGAAVGLHSVRIEESIVVYYGEPDTDIYMVNVNGMAYNIAN